MKILSVGARVFPRRKTERHDEAKSQFLQFCESVNKATTKRSLSLCLKQFCPVRAFLSATCSNFYKTAVFYNKSIVFDWMVNGIIDIEVSFDVEHF